MSTRTIIEINHDFLDSADLGDELLELIRVLGGSLVPQPFEYATGIRVLGQRHHSDPEWVQTQRIEGVPNSAAPTEVRINGRRYKLTPVK